MEPNFDNAVCATLSAVAESPMSPSTRARLEDGAKELFDMLREVATTLLPRSRKA